MTLRAAMAGSGPLVVMVPRLPGSWYSWRHQIGPIRGGGFHRLRRRRGGYGGSGKPHEIEAYDMACAHDRRRDRGRRRWCSRTRLPSLIGTTGRAHRLEHGADEARRIGAGGGALGSYTGVPERPFNEIC